MAESIYITLKINGTRVRGDSSTTTLGREGTIEAVSFEHAVASPRDQATGAATGRRIYQPFSIRKRIDRSSPLLWRALAENQAIEAEFRFFRPNPEGDGTVEQFFTIKIEGGRIVEHKLISSDNTAADAGPAMEEVKFNFRRVTVTYENGGVEYVDSLPDRA